MPTLEEKLLSFRQVDPETGCWRFTGTLLKGYGRFQFKKRRMFASRVSAHLYLELDLDDPKQFACHNDALCNFTDCFKPEHLYVGDSQTNAQDNHKKNKDSYISTMKTHCKRGHELVGRNIIIGSNGSIVCRICQQLHSKEYYKKKLALLGRSRVRSTY